MRNTGSEMKTRLWAITIVCILAGQSALAQSFFIAPAAAFPEATSQGRPPVRHTSEFTLTDEVVGNCGGFQIIANGSGTTRETLYFDHDGLPIRLHFQGMANTALSNPLTDKTVYDTPSVAHIFVDFQRQTETHVGLFFNINVPGEGTVALEVGRYVVDVNGNITFIKGQFQVSEGGLAVLCAALE